MRLTLPFSLRTLRDVLFCLIPLVLITHGFRFFNADFSHDSLMFSHDYPLGLGRFTKALVFVLKGEISPPSLIGLFYLALLILAALLLCRLFDLKSRTAILLLCALLATDYATVYIAATYIYKLDMTALGLLLTTLALLAALRPRALTAIPAGALILAFALGLYQAWLEVFGTLICLCLIQALASQTALPRLLSLIWRAAATALLGLIFYYLLLKLILVLADAPLIEGYNSLHHTLDYASLPDFAAALLKGYTQALIRIANLPTFYGVAVQICSALLLSISLVMLVKRCRAADHPLLRLALAALSLLALPLCNCLIYIISNGVWHDMMDFGIPLIWLIPLLMLYGCAPQSVPADHESSAELKSTAEHHEPENKAAEGHTPAAQQAPGSFTLAFADRTLSCRPLAALICAALGFICLSGVMLANHVYLEKDLQDKASLTVATRMLTLIEAVPGYVPGQTPVCFVGLPYYNSYLQFDRHILTPNQRRVGTESNLAFTFHPRRYFRNILAQPLGDCPYKPEDLLATPQLQELPQFPAQGAVAVFNNTIFVKISDNK